MKMNWKHVSINLFVYLFYLWEISSETKEKNNIGAHYKKFKVISMVNYI